MLTKLKTDTLSNSAVACLLSSLSLAERTPLYLISCLFLFPSHLLLLASLLSPSLQFSVRQLRKKKKKFDFFQRKMIGKAGIGSGEKKEETHVEELCSCSYLPYEQHNPTPNSSCSGQS